MIAALEPTELPADAVEVGRVLDAWGVKGWIKIMPYSASAEALFSARRWVLLPPERGARPFEGPMLLKVSQAKNHGESVVALGLDMADRTAAEALKGCRIFVPRSSFPTLGEEEYYWVDLLGLQVLNREGVALGQVHDLLSTGPQTVLVLHEPTADGPPVERMIPFVAAYIDQVDVAAKRITVDWQPDY